MLGSAESAGVAAGSKKRPFGGGRFAFEYWIARRGGVYSLESVGVDSVGESAGVASDVFAGSAGVESG